MWKIGLQLAPNFFISATIFQRPSDGMASENDDNEHFRWLLSPKIIPKNISGGDLAIGKLRIDFTGGVYPVGIVTQEIFQ